MPAIPRRMGALTLAGAVTFSILALSGCAAQPSSSSSSAVEVIDVSRVDDTTGLPDDPDFIGFAVRGEDPDTLSVYTWGTTCPTMVDTYNPSSTDGVLMLTTRVDGEVCGQAMTLWRNDITVPEGYRNDLRSVSVDDAYLPLVDDTDPGQRGGG